VTGFQPPAGEYPFDRSRVAFRLCPELFPFRSDAPIVAYGANGSKEVMARKLPGVPVLALPGTLEGFAVVHSAHISPYGAVPATIVEAPGERVDVHAIFVPDEALEALDATEPNYDRVRLPAAALEVFGNEVPAVGAPMAYLSKHGPLLVDGDPVPLGSRPQDELIALVKPAY
jgi:hypothetical protein